MFGQSDYARREVGGSVAIVGADTKGAFNNDNSRDGLYGFDAQGAYNISRYWGLKADVSYFQKRLEAGTSDITAKLFELTGGIKFQNNAYTTRLRPFGQALFGLAHASDMPRTVQSSSSNRTVVALSGTGPTFVLGGGIDIRLTRKLDLRALEIDYNPHWLKGETFHNIKLGIGVNFRF